MLLLTGPAGSGKTFYILERFRKALRRRDGIDPDVRLLVPTATMAQHLQHRMARLGLVLRPGSILTLSRFLDPWAKSLTRISSPAFHLLVDGAVNRLNRPEFGRVARLPGFGAALAQTLEEFYSAGCDSRRLAPHLPDAPLSQSVFAVFQEVDRQLEARGLVMRSGWLERAAAAIEREGVRGVHTFFLDGFYSFTNPELSVIQAIGRHADLTVTLPAAEITRLTRERLLGMGFQEQRCDRQRVLPTTELIEAPSVEREVDEIARRILEQAGAGREFRDIGIIVRTPESYLPILRATLERFGIPARFYFPSNLSQHAVVRFLAGAVDAMLGGWEHAEILSWMKMAPSGVGISGAMDRFDFEVRKRLPGRGLEPLKQMVLDLPSLARVLNELGSLESWQSLAITPSQWITRAGMLRSLFRPPRPEDSVTHEMAAVWRSQAAALDAFDAALDETSRSLDTARPMPLAEFWKAAKTVLRLTPLRIPDHRRNVVNVLSVFEARQWELPVIFVCGVIEKQFPRYQNQEPFFPDAARRQLRKSGILLRTVADLEIEEEFLFDSATSRATSLLTLSYPRLDSRGERNIPSFSLDKLAAVRSDCRTVQPKPRRKSVSPRPAVPIRDPELLAGIWEKHAVTRPTAIESLLQCPFQFFGRHTLNLQSPPPRPENRLDFRMQGNIIHKVLAEWFRDRQFLEVLFEHVFQELCEKESIPAGYRTESIRQQLLDDLRRFADDRRWPEGMDVLTEEPFDLTLGDSLKLRGRIDRIEKTGDGRVFVIDYKYSAAQRIQALVKNPRFVQGQLYLLAAERQLNLEAAGMFYCSLKKEVKYGGWSTPVPGLKSEPLTRELLDRAVETGIRAAAGMREGKVAPEPADLEPCAYCDFRDVCRHRAGVKVLTAEGA